MVTARRPPFIRRRHVSIVFRRAPGAELGGNAAGDDGVGYWVSGVAPRGRRAGVAFDYATTGDPGDAHGWLARGARGAGAPERYDVGARRRQTRGPAAGVHSHRRRSAGRDP